MMAADNLQFLLRTTVKSLKYFGMGMSDVGEKRYAIDTKFGQSLAAVTLQLHHGSGFRNALRALIINMLHQMQRNDCQLQLKIIRGAAVSVADL